MERARTSPPGLPTQQTTFEVRDTSTMRAVKRIPNGLVERMGELFGTSANSPSRSTIVIDKQWEPLMQLTLQQLQADFHHRIHIIHKLS